MTEAVQQFYARTMTKKMMQAEKEEVRVHDPVVHVCGRGTAAAVPANARNNV